MSGGGHGGEACGLWVFGYGSLMWNPGFDWIERRRALLHGYSRRFALRSVRYRGTPAAPGLVLGLDWDPLATCTGMAYRVDPAYERSARGYLHAREMVTRSYIELRCPVTLLCGSNGPRSPVGGSRIPALCYVLDRTHPQYAGGLGLEDQAQVIARAHGPAGSNADYLYNTVAHLREMQMEDPELAALEARVRALAGAPSDPAS